MVVYPRWRGELIYSKPSECIPGGLSPLARGTRRLPPAQPWIFRFIPAGAGNSGSLTQRLSALTVYPRWRGELRAAATPEVPLPGLSPLARGTQGRRYPRSATPRFIPAGAGNSRIVSLLRRPNSVYPRWRGELSMRSITVRPTSGLSPLARGTQLPDGHSQTISRFIPAGAGNSLNLMMAVTAWTVYPRWRGELCKHNLLLINDFLSQSQSTNFTVSHKQHIHYVKEYFIH